MLVLEDSHGLSLVLESLDFSGTLDAFEFSLCEDTAACWFAYTSVLSELAHLFHTYDVRLFFALLALAIASIVS